MYYILREKSAGFRIDRIKSTSLQEAKEFFSDPLNDDFIDVNTHHERQQMAENILKIIQERK